MALLNESTSFVVALVLSVVTFSGMQMARPILSSSPPFTILGGFLGSVLFTFLLTAVANLEKTVFGQNFQTKLGMSTANHFSVFHSKIILIQDDPGVSQSSLAFLT
jgi:predicted neutral ceramidase superfamily lipid hydrolase